MQPTQNPRRRIYIVAGVITMTVAAWLLLDAMGVDVPPWNQLWPLVVLLGGLASIVDFFFASRRPGSLGKGVAGIGFSALFYSFTSGRQDWRDVGDWWPAVLLIFGLAFLATWLAGRAQKPRYLVLGSVATGLGIYGLADQFDWLARWIPSPAVFWGVLLLAVGGSLLWRGFR